MADVTNKLREFGDPLRRRGFDPTDPYPELDRTERPATMTPAQRDVTSSGVAMSRRAALQAQRTRGGETMVPTGVHRNAPSPYDYAPVSPTTGSAPVEKPEWSPYTVASPLNSPGGAVKFQGAPYNLGRGYTIIPPTDPGGSWLLRNPKGGVTVHRTQAEAELASPVAASTQQAIGGATPVAYRADASDASPAGQLPRTGGRFGAIGDVLRGSTARPAVDLDPRIAPGSPRPFSQAQPNPRAGGRFGAAAPQQNPNTQQVMFGGEQAAARLGTSAETPAWVKSAAPPASGPGMPVEAAKDLADKGVSGRDVFYQTGWFRGADGTWQWVLPDAQAKLNTGQFDTSPATPAEVIIKPYTSASGQQRPGYTRPAKPETLTLKPSAETRTLPDVLDHPELYNAYPELRTATVERLPPDKDRGGLIAAYDRTDNKVMLSANRSEPEIVSTLLHEMQHGVQKFEGMAPGGSDSMFLPVGYYDRLDAASEGIKQARDATAKIIDPDTADSLTNLLIEKWVHNDNTPANNEAIDWYKRKLPSKDYNALVEAVSAMYPVQLDKDRAFTKYQNLVGETQSRKVQTEYETGNYNQYPPDMPNFAPPEQQIIRERGKYGIDLTPGRQYQEVDHDPFTPPAEAGTPMKLTPVDDDPHKFDAEDPQYYRRNFERNSQWVRPGDHNYNTQLNPQEEEQFRQWMKDNKIPFKADEKVTDYDMRGFWKALQAGDPTAVQAVDPNDQRMHYPDKWKTPYAATFSDESQWADPQKAPGWKGDQYVGKDGTVYYDDKSGHWVGPDAPWSPSPGATPLELHPTDGDPFAMPDSSHYQLPQQNQVPLPVVPAQPTAALSPSGPDPGDADLKWSWGNEYAAPAPNDPSEPQNIALNIMQPKDYPNYAQAY